MEFLAIDSVSRAPSIREKRRKWQCGTAIGIDVCPLRASARNAIEEDPFRRAQPTDPAQVRRAERTLPEAHKARLEFFVKRKTYAREDPAATEELDLL